MPFQAWISAACSTCCDRISELQWGHALSGMDMTRLMCQSASWRCFNGAMPFQAWILWSRLDEHSREDGFNGAMPFQVWISGCTATSSPRRRCFNGAMPFQAWILSYFEPGYGVPALLQWGHALSGMDTDTLERMRWGGGYSFNGAMPFQAWIPLATWVYPV